MQTKRYNVFNQIHKALRGMLYDVANSIQRTDFTQDDAGETVNKLEQLLHLFDEHADHEDKYLLTNIERYDEGMVDAFEQDHVIDRRLTASLLENIGAWRNTSDKEQRYKAGQTLFYAFNEFIGFNLYHMNREENELLCLLWRHYTDQEILAMQAQILASIAPETMAIEATWMMRSMNNPEITGWMGGVRATAPDHLFAMLVQLAEKELPAARYEAIMERLNMEPIMA
jgi:hemerythrin-like domain-containing protein